MVLLPDPAVSNPKHRLLIWNTAPDLGDDFEVWMISSQQGDPWHKFNQWTHVTDNLGTKNVFCAGHAFRASPRTEST